mmetsp:Transcript_143622/g.459502  ORF Transcript_143622/g.459502 Transcript_143622/m.459502 type:complete len:1178 (-) Transcript_143622:282-3815(-)
MSHAGAGPEAAPPAVAGSAMQVSGSAAEEPARSHKTNGAKAESGANCAPAREVADAATIAAAEAPHTPQRPSRRPHRGSGNGAASASGQLSGGRRSPEQPSQQHQQPTPKKGRTPCAQTPGTVGSLSTASPLQLSSSRHAVDSDEDDDFGDFGELCDDDGTEETLRAGARDMMEDFDNASEPPSKGTGRGRGRAAGAGGANGQLPRRERPGALPKGSGGPMGGWSPGARGDGRPPPPPMGSLKALPGEHVQKFLALVQEGDYGEALKALRKVRRAVKGRGCSKEAFGGLRALLHHLLEGYASAGRLPEALDMLRDMKKGNEGRLVSAAAFNALLRGLLARGSLHEARFIVREEMPRLGVSPNEASMNLLMDTAARAGPAHLEEAWDVLEEMQQRGMRADKYTVSILTKGITDRSERRRGATGSRGVALVEAFLVMQPEDVDEVLVNSLLDVFCRMNDMQRLEATLLRMREYGIRGSAVTYGTIVKAYGRAGCIEKVLQAWDEMSKEDLEPNAVTYGCMLDACVKCGHLDRALHVFSVMKQKNLHRNTILYATLIKGFAKSKDPSAARALHREMVAEGVTCNVVVFNSLIDACVRANELHGAAEVLNEMSAVGVLPDLITYSTLIKGYCSIGELHKAIQLTQALQARNLECDEIVFNSLLEGCVKAGDLQTGIELFEGMRRKEVRPSAVTFSILVKLFSRAGRLDLACQLVTHEMKNMHNVAPTRMVWSCLITCAVKARDVGRAAAALEMIDLDGCATGSARASMYAAVIEGCLTHNEVGLALSLCGRAYSDAPADEGPRGAISNDLLRRVFEAAGAKGGHEVEANAALDAISPWVGEQARGQLEASLSRGALRPLRSGGGYGGGGSCFGGGCGGRGAGARTDRSMYGGGYGGALESGFGGASALGSDVLMAACLGESAVIGASPPPYHSPPSAASTAPAAWFGGAGAAAWPAFPMPPQPGLGSGYEAFAVAAAAAAAAAAGGMGAGMWDPSVLATAAAAAQAGSWGAAGGYGWPWAPPLPQGAEGYGGMPFGYGDYGYGSWGCSPTWDEGHALFMAAASAASAPAASDEAPSTPCGGRFSFGGFADKSPSSAAKACERTPATTAGVSSVARSPLATTPMERSEERPAGGGRGGDESPLVQVRLFDCSPNAAAGDSPAQDSTQQVPLAALIEGPPGLC